MRNHGPRLVSPGLLLALPGCKVSPQGKLEPAVAKQAKERITVRGKKGQNPFSATPANLREGQAAFSHCCIVCHGPDGKNTGVPFAEAMAPPVPPLTSPEVQGYTDGQLKWVITNAIFPSGMPASRGILNDEERWKIILYVHHLPPKGSLDEPAVYTGAREEPRHEGERGDSEKAQLARKMKMHTCNGS